MLTDENIKMEEWRSHFMELLDRTERTTVKGEGENETDGEEWRGTRIE